MTIFKLLPLLLLVSCGTSNIKKEYYTKRLVTYRESCPLGYVMAQDVNNRSFCVLGDNGLFKPLSFKTSTNNKKTIKKPKIKAKINCGRVFKEINQCMK
jgi:hypothetical protein